MVARAASASLLSIVALCVLPSTVGAQSLGARLGSPSENAPNVPPLPPAPRTAPPMDELPDWGSEGGEAPRTVGAPRPAWHRSSSATPPDLVLTRDGGMIRGTIVQSQPGVRVVIELATGDMQEIAWSDVRFAGRAEEVPLDRPAGEASRAADPPGTLRVRFDSELRLTLHRLDGTAHVTATHGWTTVHGRSEYYERECTAPCELSLEPGIHSFALSLGGQAPFAAGSLDITRPGTLRGVHSDRSGLRAAGGVVFALGLISAAVMIPLSLFVIGDLGLFITGCVTGGLGLLVGIPMMAARSGVVLQFE